MVTKGATKWSVIRVHSHASLFLILLNANTSICGADPLLPLLCLCQWNTKPMFWPFSHGTIPTPSLSGLYCLPQNDTLKGNFLPIFSDLSQTGGKHQQINCTQFLFVYEHRQSEVFMCKKHLHNPSDWHKRANRFSVVAIKGNLSSYCVWVIWRTSGSFTSWMDKAWMIVQKQWKIICIFKEFTDLSECRISLHNILHW